MEEKKNDKVSSLLLLCSPISCLKKDVSYSRVVHALDTIKKFFLSFFFALIVSFLQAQPQVRVLLKKGTAFSFEEGEYRIFSGSSWRQTQKLALASKNKKISLNGELFPSPLEIHSSPLSFEKRKYRGFLRVHCEGEKLLIVNVIPLEDYVRGVMKMEIAPFFEKEAQKAQAVAARTYALYKKEKMEGKNYDVVATVLDQVYAGINGEDPVLNEAVEATRGEVLFYDGKPAFTVYHSESGGVTESAEEVWGTPFPYLQSRVLPFFVSSPRSSWELFLTREKIEQALRKLGFSGGAVLAMQIKRKTASGRVGSLLFTTEKGELVVSGAQFRMAIGPNLLKSTLFEIRALPPSTVIETLPLSESSVYLDDMTAPLFSSQFPAYAVTSRQANQGYYIQGKGWGHGVGMGQWDAHNLAQKGYTYSQILSFFYPGTELKKIY